MRLRVKGVERLPVLLPSLEGEGLVRSDIFCKHETQFPQPYTHRGNSKPTSTHSSLSCEPQTEAQDHLCWFSGFSHK